MIVSYQTKVKRPHIDHTQQQHNTTTIVAESNYTRAKRRAREGLPRETARTRDMFDGSVIVTLGPTTPNSTKILNLCTGSRWAKDPMQRETLLDLRHRLQSSWQTPCRRC